MRCIYLFCRGLSLVSLCNIPLQWEKWHPLEAMNVMTNIAARLWVHSSPWAALSLKRSCPLSCGADYWSWICTIFLSFHPHKEQTQQLYMSHIQVAHIKTSVMTSFQEQLFKAVKYRLRYSFCDANTTHCVKNTVMLSVTSFFYTLPESLNSTLNLTNSLSAKVAPEFSFILVFLQFWHSFRLKLIKTTAEIKTTICSQQKKQELEAL